MEGAIAPLESEPVVTAFLAGFLQATTDRRVSIVNADAIAKELGLRIDVRRSDRANAYASSLSVDGGTTSIIGTIGSNGPRVVSIDGFEVDAIPSGPMLVTRHHDVPGMIGRVGTILGEASINISTMQVSREDAGGDAIMILSTDRPTDDATIERLRTIAGVKTVRVLSL